MPLDQRWRPPMRTHVGMLGGETTTVFAPEHGEATMSALVRELMPLAEQSGNLLGLDVEAVARSLAGEGIETRRYYSPPVHMMQAYRVAGATPGALPVTEQAAQQVLTLPLWVGMTDEQIEQVADAIRRSRS